MIDPILGYRVLGIDKEEISSPYQTDYVWKKGVNYARCGYCDYIPAQDCNCGLYAFHDLSRALIMQEEIEFAEKTMVIVSLIGWGLINVHIDRYRSRYGQVVCVLDTGRECEKMAARILAVPLKGTNFESYSSEFGVRRYKSTSSSNSTPKERRKSGGASNEYFPSCPAS